MIRPDNANNMYATTAEIAFRTPCFNLYRLRKIKTIETNINPIEVREIHIFINAGDIVSTPLFEKYYITRTNYFYIFLVFSVILIKEKKTCIKNWGKFFMQALLVTK